MQKWLFIFLAGLVFASIGVAAPAKFIKPTITLNHIELVKEGEANSDELYMDITILRKDSDRTFFRIPQKPLHWSSKFIGRVKNIPLWSGEINPDEKVVLLISLMESDSSPLNPDDLIGVIRAQVSNDGGQLKVHWSIPNRPSGPITIAGKAGDVQEFQLSSEDGRYNVFLEIPKNSNKK